VQPRFRVKATPAILEETARFSPRSGLSPVGFNFRSTQFYAQPPRRVKFGFELARAGWYPQLWDARTPKWPPNCDVGNWPTTWEDFRWPNSQSPAMMQIDRAFFLGGL